MAESPKPGNNGFLQRELNGASFLGAEHFVRMALVVIVPGLLLSAITLAFGMWFNLGTLPSVIDLAGVAAYGAPQISGLAAIGVVAGLVVLLPLLLLLARRTQAEWAKRPAFAGRLAYKLPLYAALVAVGGILVWYKIQMVSVLLATVAYIGVPDAPFSYLYGGAFLPAFIGTLLYGAAGYYVFKLVKGQDYGKAFNAALAALGSILVVALFITAIVKMHGSSVSPGRTEPSTPYKLDGNSTHEPFYQ